MIGRRQWCAAVAIATAIVSMIATTGASAQSGWSAPELLTSPDSVRSQTVMVVTDAGEVVTAWVELDRGVPFSDMRLRVAVRARDGSIGLSTLADRLAGCVLDIATDDEGNVIISWVEPDGALKVARRPAGGVFESPEVVVPGFDPSDPNSNVKLTMNASGDAALAWWDWRQRGATGESRYVASRSQAGEPFGPIEQLSSFSYPRTSPEGIDLALGPDGETTVVWAERGSDGSGPWRVEAGGLSAVGAPTSAQTLAESGSRKSCPQVAADALGRVAALWLDQDCSASSLVLALKRAGMPFDSPMAIPDSSAVDRPILEVSPDGQIIVAQTGTGGGQVWTGSFALPLSQAQRVPGSTLDVAVDEPGTGVLGFSSGYGIDTARRGAGVFDGPTDWLTETSSGIDYADLDVGATGLAAAVLFPDDGHVWLSVDSDRAGSARPTAPGVSPIELPRFDDVRPPRVASRLGRVRQSRRGRRVDLQIKCNEPCTLQAHAAARLSGRDGKFKNAISASGDSLMNLKIPLPRAAATPRGLRKLKIDLDVTAIDLAGNRSSEQRSLRPSR